MNLKKSLRFLKIAQNRNSNMHIVFNNMGAAYAEIGQSKQATSYWKKALQEILKAIKLEPFNNQTHYAAGRIQSDLGNFEKALTPLIKL